MKQRSAVLFDMDGVLVSTEPLKAAAHSTTVRKFGGVVATSYYENVMGQPHGLAARGFIEAAGIAVDSKIYERAFQATYRRLMETSLEVTPGVAELLHSLARDRYLLALVSSSRRWMVDRVFAKTGLGQFFDAAVCADDVSEEKPSPEPYFHALALLELPANSAIVIEDSEAGIEAARSAGLRVISLRHEFNSRHDFSRANAVFQSLLDTRDIVETIAALLATTSR